MQSDWFCSLVLVLPAPQVPNNGPQLNKRALKLSSFSKQLNDRNWKRKKNSPSKQPIDKIFTHWLALTDHLFHFICGLISGFAGRVTTVAGGSQGYKDGIGEKAQFHHMAGKNA